MLTLVLVAGMDETRIPDHVARGFSDMTLTGAFGTADGVRRRIDGLALIGAPLGG